MKKLYIKPEMHRYMPSSTAFTNDDLGQDIIKTVINQSGIALSTCDSTGLDLELGKAIRGSMRIITTEEGRPAIVMRPYQHGENAPRIVEPLMATLHGKVTQTRRSTRITLEFPRDYSFDDISDALDDETYQIREWLEQKERA